MPHVSKTHHHKHGEGRKHRHVYEAEATDEDEDEVKWVNSLFACHNLHRYACACVCPCISMNQVWRQLDADPNTNGTDVETGAAAVGSICCTDVPCMAGVMAFNEQFVEREGALCSCWKGENDEEEPRQRLWADVRSVAHEHVCQRISWLGCLIYPLMIYPMNFYLRRKAIEELGYSDGEGVLQSAQIVCCAWPCSLVQLEDELKGHEFETTRIINRS